MTREAFYLFVCTRISVNGGSLTITVIKKSYYNNKDDKFWGIWIFEGMVKFSYSLLRIRQR